VGARYAGVAALFAEDDESPFEPEELGSFFDELDEPSVEEESFFDESPSDFFSGVLPLVDPERLSVL
jgi:hypothetical protein